MYSYYSKAEFSSVITPVFKCNMSLQKSFLQKKFHNFLWLLYDVVMHTMKRVENKYGIH